MYHYTICCTCQDNVKNTTCIIIPYSINENEMNSVKVSTIKSCPIYKLNSYNKDTFSQIVKMAFQFIIL